MKRFRLVAAFLLWGATPLSAAELEGRLPDLPAPLSAAAVAPTIAAPMAGIELPGLPSAASIQELALTQAAATPAAAPPTARAQAQLASAGAVAPGAASPEAARFAAAADGGRPLDVMVVAAEAVPYVKTGGLADVVDAVSRGLAARGHRVVLVLPNYKNLNRDGLTLTPRAQISIPMGDKTETATVLHAERNGVDLWLLDGALFNARDGPYAEQGAPHPDNEERFILLSRGALEAAKAMGRRPDVVFGHDWHAALVAPLLKLVYRQDPFFAGARSVVTIHNIAYQGAAEASMLLKAGFEWRDFRYDSLAHWDRFNFLKAGLQHADAITTVSPTYAREIQTPQYGAGLDALLRHRAGDLHGVLNGVDPALWSPESDPAIARQYGPEDVAEGKRENKTAVQMLANLNVDPNVPLFAVAARLDHQKGIDLVAEALPDILAAGGQLVVAGSGDPTLEKLLDDLTAQHPGRVFRHGFNEVFVHALYAAADFLLMPSRFEPCGLSQLIAQRFGAIPIVTKTGGLADTITDGEDGFFISGFSRAALAEGIARAKALHDDPEALSRLRRAAMAKDTSWERAIDDYVALFRRVVAR